MAMQRIQETQAFTLVETVIAMSMFVLALVLFYALFARLNKTIMDWQRQTDLENIYHGIAQRVNEDLVRSENIIIASPTTFSVQRTEGMIWYEARAGQLFRQGQAMHVPEVQIDSFKIGRDQHRVHIFYHVKNGDRTLTTDQTLFLRNTPHWTPIPQP